MSIIPSKLTAALSADLEDHDPNTVLFNDEDFDDWDDDWDEDFEECDEEEDYWGEDEEDEEDEDF